jgi:GGDEF domain-containing protein
MGYARLRWLLLAAGLFILAAITLITWARRVETVEVVATLLFIPVFLAFAFYDMLGGLAGAAVASAVYILLRLSAIKAVGAGSFVGLIIERVIGYFLFGFLGGLANRQLRASLTKLDLYDQIDDATGLFNARFLVSDTDLEMSRSKRYRSVFSVAVVDVPVASFEALPGRGRARALKDLGRALRDSVRTVDRAAHGDDGTWHRFAVILPETGTEGAAIFLGRMADQVSGFLGAKGLPLSAEKLRSTAVTFPDDESAMTALRDSFANIDKAEHPVA